MRNAASILLIIILAIITPVFLFVSAIRLNVVTAKFVKNELRKQRIYALAEDQISQQIDKMAIDPNLGITNADLQSLVGKTFPAAWMQAQVEGTLDRAFTWFNAPPGPMLTLPIDLRGPKAELITGVDSILTSKISVLPECTKRSTAKELCRRANTGLADVKNILKENGFDLAAIETQLPDTLDLVHPVLPTINLSGSTSSTATQDAQKSIDQQTQPIRDALTSAKKQYDLVLQGFVAAMAVYLLLVLGFIAINIKGWKRVVRWTGILLVSIFFLPLAMAYGSRIAVEDALLPSIHFDASVPKEMATIVPNLIRDFQHGLFDPILLVGGILFFLGLAGIIGAHWIPAVMTKEKSSSGTS